MGYFCGHDWYCFSKASNLSLEKSKNNIKNKFITIGILEEFDSLEKGKKDKKKCRTVENVEPMKVRKRTGQGTKGKGRGRGRGR